MTETAWHAAEEVLTAFARAPRALDDTTAASVEMHVTVCDRCRAVVATATDAALVAESWDAVADVIDRPRPSFAERILAAFVPGHVARVVAATPMLTAAWLAAVVSVAALAVSATHGLDSEALFLVIAPLVPLAGVAIAFAPAADPAGEATLATPMHGASLVLARTVVVVATTVPVLLLASLFLPVVDLGAVAWLLPALALTATAMALSTWRSPQVAAEIVAAAWTAAGFAASFADGASVVLARSAVFAWPGQLVCAALLVSSVVVSVARHDHFTTLETR